MTARLAGRVAAGTGIAVLSLAAALLVLSMIEDRFIYFPSRALEATPDVHGIPYEDVRLTTSDGETVTGWFVPAPEPAAVILFLHGNAGNVSHRLDAIAGLRRSGFSVLIIDYRGYGNSSGAPSEAGLHRDARAAWDHLMSRGIEPGSVVLYGESLGSSPALGLAAGLAGEGRPGPGAIVLEGAFTSAIEMGRRHFPWLPVGWILRCRLDNLSAIAGVETPTLIIHGERDEVAPMEMGRRLYEASAARLKEFHAVPMALHNTVWTGGGSSIYAKIREFVGRARLPRID